MFRAMALLAAALATASITSAYAAPADVGGTYTVNGKNADGSEYGGTAEIVVTSENTCRIFWQTGATTSEGICMRNGIAFSAGYLLGDKVGLVIYEIMDDGSMEGLWTIADQPGIGLEVLTRQ
jgi:hypothetical protein